MERETVRRFYYASSVDELFGAPRAGKPTMLDEFATHLHSRFNDRCTSAAALYEELQALGYRGSYSSVRGSLRPLRSSLDRKAVPSRLSALRQPESRYRRSGGLPHGCYDTQTASPTTNRSGSSRFLPAAHILKQLQGMSSRLRRCSPNALGNN